MNPSLVFVVILALAPLGTGARNWNSWWNYQGLNSEWGKVGVWQTCRTGMRQSPIDIEPGLLLYDPHLKKIHLEKRPVSGTIENDGRKLFLRLDNFNESLVLSGGPLIYEYRIYQVSFRWGSNNQKGSEHAIEGKKFPAEVQILAYNSALYSSPEKASGMPSGYAAISVLVSLAETNYNSLLKVLVGIATEIKYKGGKKKLTKMELSDILPNTRSFITYEGSLTEPGCSENVVWMVLNKPILATSEMLEKLRTLQQSSNALEKKNYPIENNFRQLQDLNGRVQRTNINAPKPMSPGCPLDIRKEYRSNVN